jgi:saccharopine dehydrogenase-like NADP-dependent oxidoreductase
LKALLVGAGNIGSVIARDLILSGCRDLTAADVDTAKLRAIEREHPGRVSTVELDITNENTLARLMRDCDVAINAASYRFNLHVLRAAISARCNMVDLGGLYHMTLQELKFDRRAKASGVSAVLGMGDDPGTSNIMARMASWELDSVSDVKIRWGSSTAGSEGVAFGFSVATCLDEASMKAVKLSGGKIVEVPPLSEMEKVEFPEPVGAQQTYAILHSELATLPKFITGVREVSYKDSWDQATINVVNFLLSSGFASDSKVKIEGKEVSPRKVLLSLLSPNEPKDAVGCLTVTARGKRNGRNSKITYCLGPIYYSKRHRASATSFSTAMPASIVAQMLGKGLIEQKGVFPPESLTQRQVVHFLREMESRGLVIRKLGAAA